jgi:hypothetical protein
MSETCVLLVFGAPRQLRLLTGQEHRRSIPLADLKQTRSHELWEPVPRSHEQIAS